VRILGLEVPDAGPLFLAALGVHVAAGVTCVVAGTIAATAGKRAGRHPAAGRVYFYGLATVFATATVLAVIRWRQDAPLFGVAVVAFAFGLYGRWARRRGGRRWVRHHGIGMGGSFIALLTGFYVDNGPQLPVWNRLPAFAFWVLPTAIGVVLIGSALRRFERSLRSRPPATGPAAIPP
jgi:hypothetical protein